MQIMVMLTTVLPTTQTISTPTTCTALMAAVDTRMIGNAVLKSSILVELSVENNSCTCIIYWMERLTFY